VEVGDLLGMRPVAVRVRSGGHGRLHPDRLVTQAPADRIRTLLLRADNVLKQATPPDREDRERRARAALEEARELARDPAVDRRVAELVDRRLDQLGD
jgi:hypothetical protein